MLLDNNKINKLSEIFGPNLIDRYKNKFKSFFITLKDQISSNKKLSDIFSQYIQTRHISKDQYDEIKTIVYDDLKLVGLGSILLLPLPGSNILMLFLIQQSKRLGINLLPSKFESTKSDYKSWKRKNVTIRGISKSIGEFNGGGAQFGDGLYTAHLSNKALAKQYGDVYFVVGARPNNPKVFKTINEAEIWMQQNLYYANGYKGLRDFFSHTDIKTEMLKLGYDGIEIKGREIVNYTPSDDIKYFRNDEQLLDYFVRNFLSQKNENIEIKNHNIPEFFYHGSNELFHKFSLSEMGKNYEQSILGIYFSQYEKPGIYGSTAKEYAEDTVTRLGGRPYIYKCKINYKNPLILDSNGWYSSNVFIDKNRNTIKEEYTNGNHDCIIAYNFEENDIKFQDFILVTDKLDIIDIVDVKDISVKINENIVKTSIKDILIERVPFLKEYNIFKDHKDPNRLEAQKMIYNKNVKIVMKDDIITFEQFNTSSEIFYYSNKVNDKEFHNFIIKNRFHMMQPKDMDYLLFKVFLLAMKQLEEKLSYSKELMVEIGQDIEKEELDKIVNDMNGVLFKFEEFNQKHNLNENKEFSDALLDLTTLDLEDDQVRYPKIDKDKMNFLFGGNEYYLYILNKEELPDAGPFELTIENNDDEEIGFVRGTVKDKIISFNLIHIKEDSRRLGIGTDIYEKFLNMGYTIKSDSEISDSTYNMYDRLVKYGYTPIVFDDGRVGLKKD